MKNYKSPFKRWIAGAGALVLLSVFLTSCLKDRNNYVNTPVALVTFIQASPDEPPLDFYLNNNKVDAFPVNYGQHIDYFNAFPGQRVANFFNASTMSPIFTGNIQLNQNVAYSLFLANKASSPEIVLLKDSINTPAAGSAGVRFINLSPDAPAVDLAIQGGSTVVSNKAYKGFSPFVPVPAKTGYTFQILKTGTNTVLATLPNVNLNNGYAYTIWFHGLATPTSTTDSLKANIMLNAN